MQRQTRNWTRTWQEIIIAKGTTGPRAESSLQCNMLQHNCNYSFRTWTKLQLQYFDQTSAPKSRPNFNLKILTRIKLLNLNQTSTRVDNDRSWVNKKTLFASKMHSVNSICLLESLGIGFWQTSLR